MVARCRAVAAGRGGGHHAEQARANFDGLVKFIKDVDQGRFWNLPGAQRPAETNQMPVIQAMPQELIYDVLYEALGLADSILQIWSR